MLAWCRSQRLCRHLLNVLSTSVTALDIHEVCCCNLRAIDYCCMHAPQCPAAHKSALIWLQARKLPLLTQQAERLRRTADQLAACLRVLAAMVRGEERPRR